MWICKDCGTKFENFFIRHDSKRRADGDYDDEILCPFCDSEEIEPIDDEEEES